MLFELLPYARHWLEGGNGGFCCHRALRGGREMDTPQKPIQIGMCTWEQHHGERKQGSRVTESR